MMRQCRDCDESCPFYYSDSYTDNYGCTLFGPEFKNNKLLDEDGVCHVPQIRIDYLAHMKNRYWALLEKQSYKYTSSDRKPVTSKNYTNGLGYEVVEEGNVFDRFLFPYSKFYHPCMKGGHRHNHVYNKCLKYVFRGKNARKIDRNDKKEFVRVFYLGLRLNHNFGEFLHKIFHKNGKKRRSNDSCCR